MRRSGFTIPELLTTVIILTILALVATSGFMNARRAGRDAERISDVNTIASSLERGATVSRQYPGTSGCAHGLPLSFFDRGTLKTGEVPKDSSPANRNASSCTSYLDGYHYIARPSVGTEALVKPTTGEQYEFALSVGLESDPDSDSRGDLQRAVGSVPTQGRLQYVLFGPYCGASAATNTCWRR